MQGASRPTGASAADRGVAHRQRDCSLLGKVCTESTSDFPGVLSAEVADIRAGGRRCFPAAEAARGRAGATPPHPYIEAHRYRPFGVAFSGGGIPLHLQPRGTARHGGTRPAPLHRLPLHGVRRGYSAPGCTASSATNTARTKAAEPELYPSRVPGQAADDPITFLRKYSNYLAPQLGLFSRILDHRRGLDPQHAAQPVDPDSVSGRVVLTVLMSGILQQKYGRSWRRHSAGALGGGLVSRSAVMGVNLRQSCSPSSPSEAAVQSARPVGRGIVGFATLCILFASYILGANHFDPHPRSPAPYWRCFTFCCSGWRLPVCYRRARGRQWMPWFIAIPWCAPPSLQRCCGACEADRHVGGSRRRLAAHCARPAMILMVWMCGATLQIGLMGSDFPSRARVAGASRRTGSMRSRAGSGLRAGRFSALLAGHRHLAMGRRGAALVCAGC